MDRKIWEVQYLSAPPVLRYCKTCGRRMPFNSSGRFRVNAQRRYLDIWLIYKCAHCDTTWNAAIYSRVSPRSMEPALLEGFFRNDETLARRYATDSGFLQGIGAEVGAPVYSVSGDRVCLDSDTELEIRCSGTLPIKVSKILREELRLSQREFARLAAEGRIRSIPEQDLHKCKLGSGIVLILTCGKQ